LKLPARDRVPQLLFLLVTTLVGLWARGRWLDPMSDTGFAWSVAYRLGQGERLYRDLYFPYGPLSPYLLAATGLPFGFSSLWYLLVNWIPAIAVGWLLLECGRRYLSVFESFVLATLIVGLSIFTTGTGRLVFLYYPAVVHALGFSLGALLLLQGPPERLRSRALGAGVLAGLALCCKPEIGLAAVAGLLAAGLAGVPRPVAWGGRVLAGFGLVATAAFLFVISCDSVASLRDNSHLWPLNPVPPQQLDHLLRLEAGLRYPEWPLAVRSAVFRLLWQVALMGTLALLIARDRVKRRWVPVGVLFGAAAIWFSVEGFDLFHPPPPVGLSMLAAFSVGGLALVCRGIPGRTFLAAFGIFAGLVCSRAAFSFATPGPYEGTGHLATSLTWLVLLCVVAPGPLTGGGPAAPWARRIIAVAVLITAVPYAWRGIQMMRFPSREAVVTRAGKVFLNGPQARFFEVLARELHPGERALVLPEVCAVNVLFDLRPASPFVHHIIGWFDEAAERRLIARLEADPPDVVVIFDRPTAEFGIGPFGEGFGVLLADWCRRRYQPAAETPAGVILRPAGYNRTP
jgi:hypothetical protein